jgi:hypothetical protein
MRPLNPFRHLALRLAQSDNQVHSHTPWMSPCRSLDQRQHRRPVRSLDPPEDPLRGRIQAKPNPVHSPFKELVYLCQRTQEHSDAQGKSCGLTQASDDLKRAFAVALTSGDLQTAALQTSK